MYVEVETGANCDRAFSMLYHDLEPPRAVYCLKYEVEGQRLPVRVTGWDNATNQPCPAYACKIEESGDGVALLVFGGSGGLRLKTLDDNAPWNLSAHGQWNETHLVYPKDAFIVYQDQL